MATPAAPPAGAGGPRVRGLPLWVWLAAGAVGLVVGLVLLRRQPAAGEATPGEEEEAAAQRGGGGGSASAIPAPLLEALGLKPPTLEGEWADGGYGYSPPQYDGGYSAQSDQLQVRGDTYTARLYGSDFLQAQRTAAISPIQQLLSSYPTVAQQYIPPTYYPTAAATSYTALASPTLSQPPPTLQPSGSTAYTGGTLKAL